jgi:transcriptional regulator with PAS, ATPase and Fis domain
MDVPNELKDLWRIIMNDPNVRVYNNKEELIKTITQLKNESTEAIECFKEVLVSLAELLVKISSNKQLLMLHPAIISTIKTEPKRVIDKYIQKVYDSKNDGLFRKNIVEFNEDFFLNNSFNENNDEDVIRSIFNFKSFWSDLREENKSILKNIYLTTLCIKADIRYINIHKYNEIRKLNKNNFSIDIDF